MGMDRVWQLFSSGSSGIFNRRCIMAGWIVRKGQDRTGYVKDR